MEESIAKEARVALDLEPGNGLLQQLVVSCDQVRSSKETLESAIGRTDAGHKGPIELIRKKAGLAISVMDGALPDIFSRWQSLRSPASCQALISAQLMLAGSRETLALTRTVVGTSMDLTKPQALLESAVNIVFAALSGDCDDIYVTTSMLQAVSALGMIQQPMIKSLLHGNTLTVPEVEPTLKVPGYPLKRFMHAARVATFHNRRGELDTFDMRDDKVVGGVLKLADGYFLGIEAMRSSLYITHDCREVWKKMEARKHVLYVATPGCGKSMAAMAILCQLIRLKHTVVYRSKGFLMDDQCFVFQDDAAFLVPFGEARPLLQMRETWFISDGFDTGACGCHVLLVTSPDSTKVTNFRKQARISTYIGRLWTAEELLAAGKECFPSIPGDVILHRSRLLGPVPRVVFCEEQADFAEQVGFAVDAVEATSLKHIFACLRTNSWQKFSHRVILLDRAANGSACQRLASKFVAGLVLARIENYKMDKVRRKISELRGLKEQAITVGNLVEGLFHAVYPVKLEKYTHICADGCSRTPHSAAERISDECKRDTYGNYEHFVFKFLGYFKDKSTSAVYFMPLSEEEAAIDSLYVDFALKVVHLYQLTINQQHGVIKSVISRWLAFFQLHGFAVTGLFFVTDDVSFHGMKTQAWKIKEQQSENDSKKGTKGKGKKTLEDALPEDVRQRFGVFVDAANQSSPVCQYKVLFNYDFNSENLHLPDEFKQYIESVNKFEQDLALLGHASDSRKRMRSLHSMDDNAIEETLAAVAALEACDRNPTCPSLIDKMDDIGEPSRAGATARVL